MTRSLCAALMLAALFSAPARTEDGGTWRIVNYWSEWCAPCRKELPMLNELSRQLAPLGIVVVGVNFDDDPYPVSLATAERLRIEFPTLSPGDVATLDLRPPDALPTTFILNPANQVVARLVGLQDRETILNRLADLELVAPPS